jgi:hypothetical protein
MTITALPTPPSTTDPTHFATKADALLSALPQFVTEVNAVAVAMNLNSTTDTSTTSDTIAIGATTLTVSTGKSFQPGMYLVIADTAAPSTNSMYGQITSYNSGTGVLVMNIISVLGSGTKTAWKISQSAANMDIAGTIGGAAADSAPAGTDLLAAIVGGVLKALSLTNLVAYLNGALFTPITASLGADVILTVANTYYDGPSVAQGTSGKWFVSGTVTLYDAGITNFIVKLWDGTTVIASTEVSPSPAGTSVVSLSGFISSPAGNLRISANDINTANGRFKFNVSGSSKDSTITAFRIG